MKFPLSSLVTSEEGVPYFGAAMIAICKMRGMLSPHEFLVMTFVAERTFRFGKFVEKIPLRHMLEGVYDRKTGDLENAPIGLSRSAIDRALKRLIADGLLYVDRVETSGYEMRVKWLGINTENERFTAMLPVRKQDKLAAKQAKSSERVTSHRRDRLVSETILEVEDITSSSSLRSEGTGPRKIEVDEDGEPAAPRARVRPIQAPATDPLDQVIARVDAAADRPEVIRTRSKMMVAAQSRLTVRARTRSGFDPDAFRTIKGRANLNHFLTVSAQGHSGPASFARALDGFDWALANWDKLVAVKFGWMKDKPLHPTPGIFGAASLGSIIFQAYLQRDRMDAEYERANSGREIQIEGFLAKGMTQDEAEVRADANIRKARAQIAEQRSRIRGDKQPVRADIKPAVRKPGAGRGFGRELIDHTPRPITLTEADVAEIAGDIDWAAVMAPVEWKDE